MKITLEVHPADVGFFETFIFIAWVIAELLEFAEPMRSPRLNSTII